MPDKTIIIENTPLYRLELTLAGGGGRITSDLHNGPKDTECNGSLQHYETAIDAIESLVLAHALAGVNIEGASYMNGLQTAIEAIQSKL